MHVCEIGQSECVEMTFTPDPVDRGIQYFELGYLTNFWVVTFLDHWSNLKYD